jgi:hypothetical protein
MKANTLITLAALLCQMVAGQVCKAYICQGDAKTCTSKRETNIYINSKACNGNSNLSLINNDFRNLRVLHQ